MKKCILLFFILLPCAAIAKADLRNFVVIGDSIAAGYQSGTISPSSQQNSFPALIANQAGIGFILPSLTTPPPPVPNNLAVPGERVCDTLSYASVQSNPFAVLHNVKLGANTTQISLAESSNPSILLVEIGANDVLLHAIVKENIVISIMVQYTGLTAEEIQVGLAQGDPVLIGLATQISNGLSADPEYKDVFLTSTADFTMCYNDLMNRIGNMLSKPSTVVLNIPDIMGTAYIKLLISEGILSDYDKTIMPSRLNEFNMVIANNAASHNAQLLDTFGITQNIATKGIIVGGQRLNPNLYCGITSLDGVHPTNTLDGILANNVIKLLNSKFSAGIPPLSVEQIAKVDPLIDLQLCAYPTKPPAAFSSMRKAMNAMGHPNNGK